MLGMDELLVFNVEGTAEWRHRMASEHPDDAKRNLAAADLLTRLAEEIRAFEGSALHQRVAALLVRDDDGAFSEIISQATRNVGFRSFPESGEQFLKELIGDLKSEVSLTKNSSGTIGQRSASDTQTSHPTNASMIAADRIMIVVRHLQLLRINSLSEHISTLESISEELIATSASNNRDHLESLVWKALTALGGVFDALGSEKGAPIVVSGMIAGLLSLVGGAPTLIFSLSMASWMGKDAFLQALNPPSNRRKPTQKS